jgi:hypothetical protein
MFKKIPYGVKVRVRGNDEIGYVAEYATHCSRFFPFMDIWSLVKDYKHSSDTFKTQEAAQKAAMEQYNSWISYYKRKAEEKKLKNKLANSRTIWEHP